MASTADPIRAPKARVGEYGSMGYRIAVDTGGTLTGEIGDETLAIDVAATQARRDALRKARAA